MLDVHAPHEPILGWKEFFVHLFTITIGLLIALGLEGLVEWQHHRHLVHEAEASLHDEIRHNSEELQQTLNGLHKDQADLKHDVAILRLIMQTGRMPKNEQMSVDFRIHTFDSVAWRTAHATGAAAYMPYAHAHDYADIYGTQDELAESEKQAARDAIVSLAPLLNASDTDPDPTREEAKEIRDRIELLQGQLLLVDSLMQSLDKSYQKFLSEHPER